MAGSVDGLAGRLQRDWFRPGLTPLTLLLLPLSWLFGALSVLRRLAFRMGFRKSSRVDVPVIVVGNILVGGTGKTPLVVWLVEALAGVGRRPGVILRGYRGADGSQGTTPVGPWSTAAEVGDEALLIARRTGVPVFAGRDRVAAARALRAAHPDIDVIVSDDGLQHYALARDFELAVFDRRLVGNGRLLPAGPLRERPARIGELDAVIAHADARADVDRLLAAVPNRPPVLSMTLAGSELLSLREPAQRRPLAEFCGRRCYALAGIGSPERFFDTLRLAGLNDLETRGFPDHHRYEARDLDFARAGVLLMTEKDAVKCAPLDHPDAWYLPVTAVIEQDGRPLLAAIMEKIDGLPPA